MNPALDPLNTRPGSGSLDSGDGLSRFSSTITRIFGLSMFASILTGHDQSVGGNSLKLIMLGMLLEFGRRFVQWVVERFRLRMFMCIFSLVYIEEVDQCVMVYLEYSITAEFSEGDPAYDWIINFIVRSGSV